MRVFAAIAAVYMVLAAAAAAAAPRSISIVAAENFYGDVARQIAGPEVNVVSILNNPAQDPHLFEVSASVARAVSTAQIVIANGAGYDPWIETLMRTAASPGRRAIVVAGLVGRTTGENPHIWYDPATMAALARTLADMLGAIDPAHQAAYAQRRDAFLRSLDPVRAAIAALRHDHAGSVVTATEPVFDDMFGALGMRVQDARFQLAVMNNTEPSAHDIAALERGLTSHAVKLLVYNSQVADPAAERMKRIARDAGIPVVGATETEPAGVNYQQWMLREIQAVAHALGDEA